MDASLVSAMIHEKVKTPRENLAHKFDQCLLSASATSPDSGTSSPDSAVLDSTCTDSGIVRKSSHCSNEVGPPTLSFTVRSPSRNSDKSVYSGSGRSTPTRSKASNVNSCQSSPGKVADSEPPYGIADSVVDDSTLSSSGYLNDYVDLEASMIARVKERRRPKTSTKEKSLVEKEYVNVPKYQRLPEMERLPWNDTEVLSVLRDGRTKDYSGYISVEMMQRLSFLLQRPLLRITKEIQRLSSSLEKTGRHEVQIGMKMILSRGLYESCQQACLKATALYSMSGNSYRESKSSRCGLKLSVGKFHRWLLDMSVAHRVHDFAAIYMTACMENLLEEIVLLALSKDQLLGDQVLSLDVLEYGIAANPELWGMLQTSEHLVCGRNSCGILSLPRTLRRGSSTSRLPQEGERMLQHMPRNMEQCFLTTSVDSISELGTLVRQALQFWHCDIACSGGKAPTSSPLIITTGALHTLYYFMKFSQVEHPEDSEEPALIPLHNERPQTLLPPLIEWVRVICAHVEHRFGTVVEENDIQQAARLLLPGVDCNPRKFGLDEVSHIPSNIQAKNCTRRLQNNMMFKMLTSGRADVLQEALDLGGNDKINMMNDQGLTPLMTASIHGDDVAVRLLAQAGAKIDISVPDLPLVFPCVQPETKHWTALTFASVHRHMSTTQLLLEKGANVNGGFKTGDENFAETPLQMAAAAGHLDMVSLLLSNGADPYMNTQNKHGMSYTYTTGGYNAFAMAAIHGHRTVMRKLLAQPLKSSESDILSLEEILAEGRSPASEVKSGTLRSCDSFSSNGELDCVVRAQHDSGHETEPETDSEYMTIDEVVVEINNRKNKQLQKHQQAKSKQPTKWQSQALQEALYHSSENGFLDVALELRNLGVPWTLHCWGRCLEAAHNLRRKTIVQCLLRDFSSSKLMDEYNTGFLNECLPFMFQILKCSKNESISHQLGSIFTTMYGLEPIPPIHEFRQTRSPVKIDPRYINNPELSDVQFKIKGKTFYAHKLILVNASQRFRAMLTAKQCEGKLPSIELHNVSYHVFEYVMKYLYIGDVESLHVDPADLVELMEAAHFFMLEGLQRFCEMRLAKRLNFNNCSSIYKHAKMNECQELIVFCEGFFLQNLTALINKHESFKKLTFSSKMQDYALVNGLLLTLSQRLEGRLQSKASKLYPTRV